MTAVTRLSVLAALFVSISPAAFAQVTWTELVDGGGDAGELAAGAQDLTGANYSVIKGELSFSGDVDLYKIRITAVDSFAATTRLNAGTHKDTELWLFDENLVGIYYNDDEQNDFSDHALLPRPDSLGPKSNGVYYLAVTMYETLALDATGAEIFENPRNFGFIWNRLNGPLTTNPLASWTLVGDGGNPFGTYTVTMTGTGGEFINLGTDDEAPDGFEISSAYPNPFSVSTTVDVTVDSPQAVTARLFNVIGQDLGTVFSGHLAAGSIQQVRVDRSDLPTGTYFLRIQGRDFVSTRTLTVAR